MKPVLKCKQGNIAQKYRSIFLLGPMDFIYLVPQSKFGLFCLLSECQRLMSDVPPARKTKNIGILLGE